MGKIKIMFQTTSQISVEKKLYKGYPHLGDTA